MNILRKSLSLSFNFVYFFVRNLYKTAVHRHFVNLFSLLYSPVGEYKVMSRHIGPITTTDFLCLLV